MQATPIREVEIHKPREELPALRDRFPDADTALVKLRVRYTPGEDNLEEILAELDRIFPRWYDRTWQAESAGRGEGPLAFTPRLSFRQTVLTYLETQFADPAERAVLLGLAEDLLGEEAA